MKRIAILQSNYIPWRGYFDMIAQVDEFIILDTVQYTKNDWRNRNRVRTAQGTQWLTIPVKIRSLAQRIDETETDGNAWARKHLMTLRQSYAKAPFIGRYADWLDRLYAEAGQMSRLSQVNALFMRAVCTEIRIETPLLTAYETVATEPTARVVELCLGRDATHYLSGPRARDYIDQSQFEAAGLVLEYMDYGGYAPYPQLHGTFDPAVSVIDLLLNTGPDARRYLKAPSARS